MTMNERPESTPNAAPFTRLKALLSGKTALRDIAAAALKTAQFVVFAGALALAAVFFAFTLAFSSGWALGEWLGDFFLQAQEANRVMYRWGLYLIAAAGAGLVFNTHRSRRFYAFNYLTSFLTAYLMVRAALATNALMPTLRAMYATLNPIFLDVTIALNYSTVGVKIFDYGETIAALLYVWAALIVVLVALKTHSQLTRAKTHKPLSPEVPHEDR
jgi:hypothetical protein